MDYVTKKKESKLKKEGIFLLKPRDYFEILTKEIIKPWAQGLFEPSFTRPQKKKKKKTKRETKRERERERG